MVIQYLCHRVRSFLFLIMDRLLRDNGGVVIMHDLSFLIRGMRIMEIGHFSFYMSFSSRLHHLISRHVDFNSGTWPKCCGMGMVSLWAELLYWGGGVSPNSLYRAEVWACVPRFALWAYVYVVPYPISSPPTLD